MNTFLAYSQKWTYYEQQANLTADTTELITDTTELDIEFHEDKILKMLEKLNVSKSPGPDGLHPRILYETRTKITNPLKLIFEASLKLKELLIYLLSIKRQKVRTVQL